MVFSKRFPRALLALGLPLTTPVALAGYTFEDGNLKGEVNLTVGGATLFTRGVNFGSGQVDARSGKNGGVRINWQEVYLKPGVKLEYALQPDWWLRARSAMAMRVASLAAPTARSQPKNSTAVFAPANGNSPPAARTT